MSAEFRSTAVRESMPRNGGYEPASTTPERARAVAGDAANDNDNRAASLPSIWRADALAIDEPVPVASNQSRRVPRGRVPFDSRTRPFVNPLTGWTGGSDPLTHVELRFPDREMAERYCRREGLPFRIASCPITAGGMPASVSGRMVPQRRATEDLDRSGLGSAKSPYR